MSDSTISFMLHNFIHTTDCRGVKTSARLFLVLDTDRPDAPTQQTDLDRKTSSLIATVYMDFYALIRIQFIQIICVIKSRAHTVPN